MTDGRSAQGIATPVSCSQAVICLPGLASLQAWGVMNDGQTRLWVSMALATCGLRHHQARSPPDIPWLMWNRVPDGRHVALGS